MSALATLVKHLAYIVFGGLSAATNALLVLAIMTGTSRLRHSKEYLVIAGLAFADFAEGFAQLLAGGYRIAITSMGLQNKTVSRAVCMSLPHSNIWRWTEISTSGMLLAISLDRLYAVQKPLAYYGLGCRYAYQVVGGVYSLATVHLLMYWGYAGATYSTRISSICGTNSIVYALMYTMSKMGASALSASSVLVYVAVAGVLHCRLERISGALGDRSMVAHQRRKQARLTATMGVSCALTFALDAAPKTAGVLLSLRSSPADVVFGANLAQWVMLGNKLNAAANFALLTYRHRRVRRGVRDLLTCRRRQNGEPNRWQSGQAAAANGQPGGSETVLAACESGRTRAGDRATPLPRHCGAASVRNDNGMIKRAGCDGNTGSFENGVESFTTRL